MLYQQSVGQCDAKELSVVFHTAFGSRTGRLGLSLLLFVVHRRYAISCYKLDS